MSDTDMVLQHYKRLQCRWWRSFSVARSCKWECESVQVRGMQIRGFKVSELQGFWCQTMIKRSHNISFFFKKKTNVNEVTQHRFLKKPMLSFLYIISVTPIFGKTDVNTSSLTSVFWKLMLSKFVNIDCFLKNRC